MWYPHLLAQQWKVPYERNSCSYLIHPVGEKDKFCVCNKDKHECSVIPDLAAQTSHILPQYPHQKVERHILSSFLMMLFILDIHASKLLLEIFDKEEALKLQ